MGQKLAESKIKLMTGGNRISCRALYKDFFEFDPQFKLWITTNNLPNITGTDEAIWRRIMVIPFPVTIPAEERDKTLADRLVQELPGIFNWAIDGLKDWQVEGLNPPAPVQQSIRNYRSENDTVTQWLEAACNLRSTVTTTMKDLYESYRMFCENSGLEGMSNSGFGKELTRRRFESVKLNSGNARRGIALKASDAERKKAMFYAPAA